MCPPLPSARRATLSDMHTIRAQVPETFMCHRAQVIDDRTPGTLYHRKLLIRSTLLMAIREWLLQYAVPLSPDEPYRRSKFAAGPKSRGCGTWGLEANVVGA